MNRQFFVVRAHPRSVIKFNIVTCLLILLVVLGVNEDIISGPGSIGPTVDTNIYFAASGFTTYYITEILIILLLVY